MITAKDRDPHQKRPKAIDQSFEFEGSNNITLDEYPQHALRECGWKGVESRE